MRNILSYQFGTEFKGEEILTWAKYQVENKTSHTWQGAYILRKFGKMKPKRKYYIKTSYEGTGCGEIIHKPLIIRAV